MINRDYIEGLMAASLYEPLNPEEQGHLNAWLLTHPADAVEYAAMQRLVDFVPTDAPAFAGDLRPVLREELLKGAGWRFEWSLIPRYAFQFAGALAIALILVVPLWQGMGNGFVRPLNESLARLGQPAKDDTTEEAETLIANGEVNAAHALLSERLAQMPQHPAAGVWQMDLAKLEFEQLGRYAQAFDAYQKLRREYGDVFASVPENAYRFDVLEQTSDDRFEPLYVVAQARDKGMGAFPQLEHVVARYSGRGNPVAELALNAMSELSGGLPASSPVFRVAGYEKVRSQCSNPVALAQLNDSLGQMYLDHTGNTDRARELFQEVVECGNTPLAADAQVSLARLQ